MNFVTGTCRHQTYFATLDDQVAADNPARLVDAFVDKLELHKPGFTNTVHKREGRPTSISVISRYERDEMQPSIEVAKNWLLYLIQPWVIYWGRMKITSF